ncbi:uncharacterized protein LOC133791936 [Humulus lupulus]|uniref:uncharacterized protein LOC133791936 n=1 Tax=Humulus lupulus TaxID=3486 RepID=UPI002B411CF7|nr:uncharacterized protein LOC133791936 [Humulus lupulus]
MARHNKATQKPGNRSPANENPSASEEGSGDADKVIPIVLEEVFRKDTQLKRLVMLAIWPLGGSQLAFAKPLLREGKLISQVDVEEIEVEASFWNSTMVCIVLGANPPFAVFEGFIKRLWGKLGIDRIARMNAGYTIVKFRDEATRDMVLEAGVTKDRSIVKFARMLVDVEISNNLPKTIIFLNERGRCLEEEKVVKGPVISEAVVVPTSVEPSTESLPTEKAGDTISEVTQGTVPQEGCNTKIEQVGLGAFLETKLRGNKVEQLMKNVFVGWDYYSSQEVCLTFVYGKNTVEERQELWKDLASLVFPVQSWLLAGDFNAVFDYDDRIGVRLITDFEMVDAQQWRALGLVDELRLVGSHYTWSNKQEAGARIFSNLDRVFKNEAWVDIFPHFEVLINWDVVSDHCFCIIKSLFAAVSGVYESFLSQRSKIAWIRFGDENSAYFHACLKQRKAANRITSFIDDQGQIQCKFEDVVGHFINHFRSFMGSSSSASSTVQRDCFVHGATLSLDQQLGLLKPFTKKDVKSALFSISFIKSPSPDGFGSGFYKVMWKDLGDEIADAILGFFDKGELPTYLNNTILSLIPKVENPSKDVDFRPTAYCNTLYKCISKMLCDLIKRYNRKNVSPRCVMKIDLSKAYDTIDWFFLEDLLKAYCFPNTFIHWIMVCLRGTSYSLLMNDRVQGKFIGRKGLRQGDPISPLQFVLVMEYLTRILIQASLNKDFRFHPLCKNLKLVSLCFADDLVLFCKGTLRSVQILQDGFSQFSQASGLSANLTKSHIYFGGLNSEEKKCILDCLNIEEGSFPLKYLGVPLHPTKWKAGDCGLIIKKINLRLHSWASRHLSFAGRAQLIHSVLLGIWSYWMSIFLLPQSVTLEFDRLCRKFLWGSIGNRSKMHFTAWDHVCLPKSFGGIGFKEGSKWNKVLLAKYVWVISSKQDLLWVKWIDDIYLKGESFWAYTLKADASWYWRKLVNLKSFLSRVDLEATTTSRNLNLTLLYNLLLQ